VESSPARGCSFSDLEGFRRSDVCLENAYAIYASIGFQPPQDVLPDSGIIVPLEHRSSLFDLSPEEWRATYDLLVAAKQVIAERWRPDGYTVGWNVGAAGGQEIFHAHLRVIPGFDDEPQAGRGIRWAIKQTTNRRPNPDAPGRGLA
jgi:diadenosine tetraphosphate (Ap4A) HIT family hydrolase